ncbi:MAG: DUF4349 domain-containing protein [Steroidobacteraceae bacterium]
MPRNLEFSALLRMIVVALCLPIAACEQAADKLAPTQLAPASAPHPVQMPASPSARTPRKPQLAREDTLTLEVGESDLPSAYHRIIDGCQQPAIHCTLLSSDLTTGRWFAAHVRMRVSPADLPTMEKSIGKLGEVIHQSSLAEDLTDSIADTDARLAMARDYRQKLLDLQAKSGNNVDSAIKVAGEIVRVQQELEQLEGEHAGQQLRVETEVLEVRLQTPRAGEHLHPVREAIHDFGDSFSNGIGVAITGMAYLAPWLLVLVPLVLGMRWLWRGRP